MGQPAGFCCPRTGELVSVLVSIGRVPWWVPLPSVVFHLKCLIKAALDSQSLSVITCFHFSLGWLPGAVVWLPQVGLCFRSVLLTLWVFPASHLSGSSGPFHRLESTVPLIHKPEANSCTSPSDSFRSLAKT